MGSIAKPFMKRVLRLFSKYPILRSKENLHMLISSKQHYEIVIETIEKIFEKHPDLMTNSNLALLSTLSSYSAAYSQHAVHTYDCAPDLFPVPYRVKEIEIHGKLRLIATSFSHLIYIGKKSTAASRYSTEKKRGCSKEWVAKLAARFSQEMREEIKALGISFNEKNSFRYPYSISDSLLTKYVAQESLSENDLIGIREDVYTTIATAISSSNISKTIPTKNELYISLNERIPDRKFTKEWIEAYIATVEWMEEKLEFLFSLLQSGPLNDLQRLILTELQAASLFPMKRATFLHESGEAQLEVVAQELRRALCPFDLLGRNPFPKYRLAVKNSSANQSLRIIPEVPDTYIISEKIVFEDDISYGTAEEGRAIVFEPANRIKRVTNVKANAIRIEEIPGLGTVCFFAKFLGDIDAKVSNLGISVDSGSATPYVFTALDSGLCFGRPYNRPAHFTELKEVIHNPHTYSDYSHNFFLSRSCGSFNERKVKELLTISQHPQVRRENYICAFNVTFTPPLVYLLFLKQYLAMKNNYVVNKICKRIYDDHLLKEQQTLFEQFQTGEMYLRFFLESDHIQDNLFYRYQLLVFQIESFCFYEKKTFRDLVEFQAYPDMMAEYFLQFIVKRYQEGKVELNTLIEKAFRNWNPSHIMSIPVATEVDLNLAVARGEELKRKVGHSLGFLPDSSVISNDTSKGERY